MRSFLPALLLAVSGTSHAATLTWPGLAAPCNAGLQACIDAATPGDVIELATNTPIPVVSGAPVTINKSLTLRRAVGFYPNLEPYGLILIGNTGATGLTRIIVDGIHLPRGRVLAIQSVDQILDVTVQRMRIETYGGFGAAVEFRQIVSDGSAAMLGRIEDNDIQIEGQPSSGTIYASSAVALGSSAANPGPLEVDVFYNRVRAIDTGQTTVMPLYTVHTAGRVRFHANRIEGRNFNTGISVYSGAGAASGFRTVLANNVVIGQNGNVGGASGIDVYASQGTLNVEVTNNTVIRGRSGIAIGARPDLGGMVYANVVNNLVAYNSQYGLSVESALETPPLPPVYNANTLVYGNGHDFFTPGPGTLTANPRLQYASFRLRDDSPARNAGHANAVPVLASHGIPALDVDGLRRLKNGSIDIGAHEVGARSDLHVADAGNSSGATTTLAWDAIDGNANAHFVVTPNWNPPGRLGYYIPHYTGLETTGSGAALRWRIVNEDGVGFPTNTAFNLFLPDAGSGLSHLTTAGNTSAGQTFFTSPELDASASLIVHARHHRNGDGATVANLNLATFVGHFDDAWRLAVPSPATMSTGTGFMLTMQERAPNAFLHSATGNSISSNWTTIDHPRLNSVHCAQLSVTATFLPNNPHPIGVWYNVSTQRHAIFNQDMAAMPVGANFHVSFDPAQVEACTRSDLFGDGFED